MVGRREALAQVSEALSDAGRGPLVIRGPAGIGKSRLVEEAVEQVAPTAWRVRASAPMRTSPLAPFALVAPQVVVGASERKELVRAAITAIEADPPVAIWFDDIHHLDAESATVAFHLARNRQVPIVATVRAGEAVPAAMAALLGEGAPTLDLGPLTDGAVGELAASLLGGELAHPSLRRLATRSGGNPLLVRELVRVARRDGDLTERGGLWHLARQTTPVRLEDLVADHALGVSEPAVALFRHLAVADQLPVAVLDHLAPAGVLGELEDAGLVRSAGADDRVPDHPLFAEMVRARLAPAERMAVAGALATAIDALPDDARRPDHEVRAVRWRLEAGIPVAPARASAVAWMALSTFDLDLTIAAASSAVAGGLEGAELPLATALAYAGRHVEARPHFERAAAAADGEWALGFAKVAGTLNRAYHEGWGDWVAEAHRAAAEGISEPGMRLLLRSEETSALAFAGRLDEALALGRPEVVDADVDPSLALPYVPGYAAAATARGQTGEVIDALARLQRAVRDAPTRAHAWLHAFRAQADAVHGNLEDAAAAMGPFDDLAYLAMVEDVAAVLSSEMRGLLALWRGDIDGAVRWLGEAVVLSDVPESRFRRVIPWAHLTQARALAGDVEGAQHAARETGVAARMFPLGAGYVGSARAWARRAAGDATGAAKLAASEADRAEAAGLATAALWTSVEALRHAPSTPVAAAVVRRAAAADGRWAAAFGAHGAGIRDRSPELLLDAADRYREIGAARHEHEVLALAAAWLRADGRRDGARRARTGAAAAAARCRGIGLVEVASLDDPAVASLTPRERQVSALVAGGCTNAQAAERLGLSIRTTEGHLAKAMAKLDVTRRTDLAHRLAGALDDA